MTINNIYSFGENSGLSTFARKRHAHNGETRPKVLHKIYLLGKCEKTAIFQCAKSARKFAAERLNREYDNLSVEGVEVTPDSTKIIEMLLRDNSEDGGFILVTFADNQPVTAERLENPPKNAA